MQRQAAAVLGVSVGTVNADGRSVLNADEEHEPTERSKLNGRPHVANNAGALRLTIDGRALEASKRSTRPDVWCSHLRWPSPRSPGRAGQSTRPLARPQLCPHATGLVRGTSRALMGALISES